ncbi:sensor histidine kinase [Deinococcus sp.]|uniref:sensor histidine kinase n=1 Tax=Deinococcus sp. TaxID=47478 RepID=UPI003CC6A5C4
MKRQPQIRAESAHVEAHTRRGRWNTLRFQFTLVIFLLAFLPNAVLTVFAGRQSDLGGLAGTSLALWLAAVAALSALIGWVLSGALLRPLNRLTGELGRGEFQGQGGQGLSDDPQEVRALRSAFGGLLRRLGTEQERRGAFMATLVHDLKTPLIATGHLIGRLSEGALPPTERGLLSEQLLAENARLLGLVQQMADAHRFERDDIRLTLVPTDLRALLEQAAARQRSRAADRGVVLAVEGAGVAEVDVAVLERAIGNLIDNALRYARRRIELHVESGGLSVRDDGPGLPESVSLDSLAQPFNAQPVEIAGQRYTAGTAGLGLYIVRRIVEAHGGALHYRRDVDADGAVFTVMQLGLPAPVQPPGSRALGRRPHDSSSPDRSAPDSSAPSSSRPPDLLSSGDLPAPAAASPAFPPALLLQRSATFQEVLP